MLFIMRMQNKRQSHGPQTEMQILEKSAYVGKKSTSMRYARMSVKNVTENVDFGRAPSAHIINFSQFFAIFRARFARIFIHVIGGFLEALGPAFGICPGALSDVTPALARASFHLTNLTNVMGPGARL